MAEAESVLEAYRFGGFRLSISDRILERDGERIQLTPKAIDTLFVLVENAGRVVTKEWLIEAVWPDVTVVESGLTRNISVLRKALEEGQEEGSFIETIPRRGYRFVAEVHEERRTPAAEEPAPPRKAHQRWRWIAAVAAAALSVLAVSWTWTEIRNRNHRRAVEPLVGIGEHLLYKLAPEQTVRASEHFARAIEANPQSASGHAGLAVSLVQLSMLGVRPLGEVVARADGAARRAVELDPHSGTAHYAAAMIRMVREWDFRAAEQEFRTALELEPESVQTRLGYARLKAAVGDIAEARRLAEEALRLDPASPALGTEYCRVFYFARDFQRAAAECRKVLEREPGYALAHYYLALSLGWLGEFEAADQSLTASGLMPGMLEADRAWVRLRAGDRRPALAVLEQRREFVRNGTVTAAAKLLPATILNYVDEAFAALETGVATRDPDLLTIHIEPRLDPLRKDPRYPRLLARMGLVAPAD